MHIIAADVGGTKTRLMTVDADCTSRILYEARYASGEFDGFEPMLRTFLDDSGHADLPIRALTLALPGIVEGDSAVLTNLPWSIEKRHIKARFGIDGVYFMNDFQASASGTSLLDSDDLLVLNAGQPKPDSTRVAVGAGTGLGVSWVQGGRRASRACDTEGGHIDFAPVDAVQIALLDFLIRKYGHVSYERILSGEGLVNLYAFFSDRPDTRVDASWVNRHAGKDPDAQRAVNEFIRIYGAYVGNIALIFKPASGIYITGGIAAKMQRKMQSESFLQAYLNKGRMRPLLEKIAVYLVTNERVGVLGAMSETVKMQTENPKKNA